MGTRTTMQKIGGHGSHRQDSVRGDIACQINLLAQQGVARVKQVAAASYAMKGPADQLLWQLSDCQLRHAREARHP